MQYATLELMQALRQSGVEVINFTSGWRNILTHRHILHKEKFPVRILPLPQKLIALLGKLGIYPEKIMTNDCDYFFQIGLHANRTIPSEKLLLSIHDIVPLRYPEGELPFPPYAAELIKKAKLIFTVSEFSKKEILSKFKLAAGKIQVIHNGIDHSRFNLKIDRQELLKVRKKYALSKKYLLTYGGNAKRKNIERLCQAFSKTKLDLPLVVFGGYRPAKSYPNTTILSYLPKKDVETILKGAYGFVFPSYYEGFGLPVIEALSCGIPTACAKVASLPEISGDCTLLFNPFEENDIKAKIIKLVNDTGLRKANRAKGLKWGKRFSWTVSAKKMRELLVNCEH